jgi:threonine dehydrogenase-like Zn-dependent dehydrogenase
VATDAVKTSYHAITRRAEVKPHQTVFLFGLGGLGFNALQIILHIGARVLVSDVRQERLEEAVKIGVPQQDVVPVGQSIREFVQERGLLIDTTLDFVGKHQTFQDAQNIRKAGSEIILTQVYTDSRYSSKGGQNALRWNSRYKQHDRHEDWHQEEAHHSVHIRRADERFEGGSRSHRRRSYPAAGGKCLLEGLPSGVERFM